MPAPVREVHSRAGPCTHRRYDAAPVREPKPLPPACPLRREEAARSTCGRGLWHNKSDNHSDYAGAMSPTLQKVRPPRRVAAGSVVLLALGAAVGSLGATVAPPGAVAATAATRILAVGAERQYADVLRQIGGDQVFVASLMTSPNADPHTFEASPGVARTIATARIVVQNGLGYDSFMNKLEAATPSSKRVVISAQYLRGLPDSTVNPHLWYSPETMPLVARAVASVLSSIDPGHKALFAANLATFDSSLRPWLQALRDVAAHATGISVASTEPVADALLFAAKVHNATPWAFQTDVMNGVDPAPQSVGFVEQLLASRKARVFLYNEQVTDMLTTSLLQIATSDHVPVVAVYETMPPGYHYQRWMLAETNALLAAIEHGTSTRRL